MSLSFGCLEEGCETRALLDCYNKQTSEEIYEALAQNRSGYCKEHRDLGWVHRTRL